MRLPQPVPGLVIRYAYLWHREAQAGRDEGVKDRPCAIVLARYAADSETIVTVVPMTTTPSRPETGAVRLPTPTQQRLGLDRVPAWILTNEINRFVWPGPDLRPVTVDGEIRWAYGFLPYGLREAIRDALKHQLARRRLKFVNRD